MKKALIGIGLLGVGFGIYSYIKTQLDIFKNTTIKILRINSDGIKLKKINLEVIVEVVNDSTISFDITDYYFDVFLDNLQVASVTNKNVNQLIKGNGESTFIPIKVSLNTADVIIGALSGLKDTKLNINGYFGIKKGIVKFRNINVVETIELNDFL